MNTHWSVADERIYLQLLEFLYGVDSHNPLSYFRGLQKSENQALAKMISKQINHHIPDMEHTKTLKAAKVSTKSVDVFICGFYVYNKDFSLSVAFLLMF